MVATMDWIGIPSFAP